MLATDIIARKRDGFELSTEEIGFFVAGLATGSIPDYQVAAWAMAVVWRGMTLRETTDLTLAMARSGEMLDLRSAVPFAVDKHSTGGVGDKTTLVVEPVVAACGIPVAKMSGHGLGFSGGTLDKMESIPGFRTRLSREEFLAQLREIGLVLCGQTSELAPADGRLYALRDVTATVPSLPLIASSVMSKKIAAGAQGIVLDVKVGLGAFMATVEEATQLARLMVRIGIGAGRRMVALVSDMNEPLGRSVGNALEVREAIDTLRGSGPADLREHCLHVAAHMIRLARPSATLAAARSMATQALDSGEALRKFRSLVAHQGGQVDVVDDPDLLPRAPVRGDLVAERSGWLAKANAGLIAEASLHLGAGRTEMGARIDHSVGIVLAAKVGDPVAKGQPLCTVHAGSPEALRTGLLEVQPAFVLSHREVAPLPLFYQTVRR